MATTKAKEVVHLLLLPVILCIAGLWFLIRSAKRRRAYPAVSRYWPSNNGAFQGDGFCEAVGGILIFAPSYCSHLHLTFLHAADDSLLMGTHIYDNVVLWDRGDVPP